MAKCKVTYLVTCENSDCGSEFEILKKTYDNRIWGKIPILCPECMKIYKSNEQSESQCERYANMSEEDRSSLRQTLSEASYRRYEDPAEHEKTSKAAYKRYEDPKEHEKTSESVKRGHANMTPEAVKSMHEKQTASVIKTWDSRGPEERKAHGQKVSKGLDDMPEEDKILMKLHESISQTERFANMTFDDKIQYYLNRALKTNAVCEFPVAKFDSKTEKAFYWFMKDKHIKIGYHFYNITIHPQFYEMFKDNPYSKYNYASPFHEWDFVIFTYKTPILIDLDGEYHDPKRNKYNTSNKYKIADDESITMNCYYDLRRKYQTDGYPAYAILCYNNFFDIHNRVIDINDPDKILSVMDLLQIIGECNDPKYLEENK